MLSDNDLLSLLAEIEAMALQHYPFPADAQLDPRLPFALGRIAGIAGAALLKRRQLQEHIPSPTCWCNPVMDDQEPDVYLHSDTTNAALQGEDA